MQYLTCAQNGASQTVWKVCVQLICAAYVAPRLLVSHLELQLRPPFGQLINNLSTQFIVEMLSSQASQILDGTPWHDSFGTKYNCTYYEQNSKCGEWGHLYSFLNRTANDACCGCAPTPAPTSFTTLAPSAPTPSSAPFVPSLLPSINPSTPVPLAPQLPVYFPLLLLQTPLRQEALWDVWTWHCLMVEIGSPWHDQFGTEFNCAYYDSNNKCGSWGFGCAFQNLSASKACCTCANKSRSPTFAFIAPTTLTQIQSPTTHAVPNQSMSNALTSSPSFRLFLLSKMSQML